VTSNDYETVSQVFAEINFIKEVILFSDRCSNKDLEKMETDYNTDLVKSRYSSKATVAKYIKQEVTKDDKKDTDKEKDEKPKESEISTETIISQNPKLNINVAPGFAK